MNEKLKKLLLDEDFINNLESCKTKETVFELFKQHGFDLTIEELQNFVSQLDSFTQNGEELSEDELENVSGGGVRDLFESAKRKIKDVWKKLFG